MMPKGIKKTGSAGIELTWPDGSVKFYPAKFLRENCRCAVCVNEDTGERVTGPGNIPEQISILKADTTGNYGLSFVFSDGHGTGIYSFDYLHSLAYLE